LARTDGADLRVVLRPGAGAARVGIGVRRLQPFGRYLLHGAVEDEAIADNQGRIHLEVDLCDRTEVSLMPAA
jgi:hypothetical protein